MIIVTATFPCISNNQVVVFCHSDDEREP